MLRPMEMNWNAPGSACVGRSQSASGLATQAPVLSQISGLSSICHLDFDKARSGPGSHRGPTPPVHYKKHSPRDASLKNLYNLDWSATGGTEQMPHISLIHRSTTPPLQGSKDSCSPALVQQQQQLEQFLQPHLYQPQPVSRHVQHVVAPTDADYSEDEALTATPYELSPNITPFNPNMPCTGIPAAGDAPKLSLDPEEVTCITMNPRSPRRPATSLQRFQQALRRVEKENEPNKENMASVDNNIQRFDKTKTDLSLILKGNVSQHVCTKSNETCSPPETHVEVDEQSTELPPGKVSSPPGKHFAWETLPDMATSGREDLLPQPLSLLPGPLTMKPLKKWTVDDVKTWVACTPLPPQVGDLLCENAINGPVLESLTDKDLVGLGIQKFGWRRQLLLSRKELCDKLGPKFFNIYSSTPSLVPSDDPPSPEAPSPVQVASVPDSARGMESGRCMLMEPPLSHRSMQRDQSPLPCGMVGPFGVQREFLSFAPCARPVMPSAVVRGTSMTRSTSVTRAASPSTNARQGCTASPARQHFINLQLQGGLSMPPPRVVGASTQCKGPLVQAQAVCRTSSPTPGQILTSGPMLTARRATSQPRRAGSPGPSPGPALRTSSPGPSLKRARSRPAVQRSRSPVASGRPVWLM
eukprot:gnl/MRDRNA2_/MRDRNA2_124823_c0_seq1.p1 gnl/MRDRNA2_/MRDRNA2_124823_c0~~gnl/MRDRNA2_/MRDRNA2_124823_c0_seq1.p1  ORF type:complete len:642 (+),score=84.31 gnl/MRDRNA2_/MRDRNA2_124823_c0_seq1:96-2021(+)